MYLIAVPSGGRDFLNGRFEHGQTEKVHIAILLLIVLVIAFGKLKAVQWAVIRWMAFYGRICFFLDAC